jgi:hypothetical protein
VRVIGNHHHFHHGSLEFLARSEGRRLRFVPGLSGDLASGSSLAPLLDADFILIKEGKDPGPDFSIPKYEKVRASLEEENGTLSMNYQEILRVYMPDGDEVVGYRKKEASGIEIAWKIDWGIGWIPGYRLSSRELGPGEPLTLTVDWRLTPKLVRSYVFFVHLIDDRGADVGDFLHPDQRSFARFEDDIDMNDGLQGPVPCEYVVLMEREGKPLPAGDYLLKVGIWEPSKGKDVSGRTPDGAFEGSTILRDTPIHVLPSGDDPTH